MPGKAAYFLLNALNNARPYAFLDDAPLEERRAHAVQTRRAGDPADAHAVLDADAIARVRDEVGPDPRDADELHDTLLTCAFLLPDEASDADVTLLTAARRATRCALSLSHRRRGRSPGSGIPPQP